MARHLRAGCKKRQERHKRAQQKSRRLYVVTDPTGRSHLINNLARFAREHGLNQGDMSAISRNGRKHKGYAVRIAPTVRRDVKTFSETWNAIDSPNQESRTAE
jgi:hypothetical protein